MAYLSKTKNNKHRVRFTISFPDGSRKERARQVAGKSRANEVLVLAGDLELKTRRQNYNQGDVELWTNEGVILKPDADQLRGYESGHKTLQQAADEYRLTWNDISREEEASREGRVNRIVEVLGPNTAIQSITYLDGERFKNTLRNMEVKRHPKAKKTQKLKAATINKHLQDLKRIFKIQLAMRSIEHYPFTITENLKIPKAEKIQHVRLTEEEICKVIDQAEEKDKSPRPSLGGSLTLHLLMFFGCGMRRKEAMNARLENIDWLSRELLLIDTKNGEERKVGLGQRLYKMLLALDRKEGFILPRFHQNTVTARIMYHFKACGHNMRLHDTRHTFTTNLLNLGVSKRLVMTRTGHKDERMLTHYDHPETSEIFEDNFSFMQERGPAKKDDKPDTKRIH